ncbi:fumarylacetoacetase [Xanthocytophaga flava]|uniref:fumarylacetoacetase n=1 Tax=Xanthocytophaga flava TaxID=3048013 RepID=UPI0028D373CF|nr:fumarylacetoacetase [Xanthocytophaga flavus]MDJ1468669.1 fumarylacetoacetase [Xanthocytophaga flavus]
MKKSWVPIPEGSDFPLENLPYGIFQINRQHPRAGVAIGEYILDLHAVASVGLLEEIPNAAEVFGSSYLNAFMALGKPVWQITRQRIMELLLEGNNELQSYRDQVLVRQADATLQMPVQIGNYTDFYSSIEHATNVGKQFRPDNPLLPNWKHLPIAYHGRASSIVISGTNIHRPKGQRKAADADLPTFGPSKRMDFELEVAFVIGKETALGQTVSTSQAEEHIFGFFLFNDWSARDIQGWEYQPLGPFLGKNFASSISPWIVTLDALEPFRTGSPVQNPAVLPYLQYEGEHSFDIQLEVAIQPEGLEEQVVCRSNFNYLYWNICQQLAHHTVNGCNLCIGDVMASGTISGESADSWGSLLELTEGGKKSLIFSDGIERKFLEDNDTVVMRGFCEKDGLRIGFGEVRGKLLPSL